MDDDTFLAKLLRTWSSSPVTPSSPRSRSKLIKRKPRLYIRKFLNKPGHHTVASVLCSVNHGDVTFILSDCDRTIKLDFNGYRAEGRKNSIYKAQALIDVLSQFKSAMEEEFKTPGRDDEY